MQENWDSQRKPAGAISIKPQDERKAVQKRTFTRWMNVFLQRHDPPDEVHDLFADIQDGRILMALLEELSGCKLLYRFRPSSHRIFRLNNISKALAFLDDRHVKLFGIDASGIADGTASVVLNLVWNIILHFQVKEVTGGLQRHLSSSLSSLSVSSYPSSSDLSTQPNDIGSYSCSTLPSKGRKAAREPKYHGKAIKTLLLWAQRCTSKYGVDVHDFGKSWRSGLAFLALIKSINPGLVDLKESLSREPKENIQLAFMTAHQSLDIPPLLEPEDVMCTSPDEQSIITYISMFLGHHSSIDEDHSTDTEVPEIPNFGSLEPVSFGETLADDPEAQALLKGLETSSEQQLWKRWSRRSSGSPRVTSRHMNGASDLSSNRGDQSSAATSLFSKNKGRSRSVLQPPSPLDAGVANQEIRLWLEKGSDHGYGKRRADESHFSLSSEEGIYSVSALDSDEEDAYSYILDLNKEVFQPYSHLKRQVEKVEEETAEELNKESEHLEGPKMFNGGGRNHQEGYTAQNAGFDLESEDGAQSVIHKKFNLDKNESNFRQISNNKGLFDLESERRSNEEEERLVRGQSNDDGDYCEVEREKKKENARLAEDGCDKTEDDGVEEKISEVGNWQKEAEEEGEEELSEKWGQVSEWRTVQEGDEGEDLTRFEEGQDLSNEREEVGVKEEERGNQKSVNLESLEVGVKEGILTDDPAYEFRRTDAASQNTEERDWRDNAVKMDLNKNCTDVEKTEDTEEEMNSTDFEPAAKAADGKERELEIRRHRDLTITDRLGETTPQKEAVGGADINGGDKNWTPACSATSESFSSEGGFTRQPLAASFDVTPSELEMLLVLWILLYCCLILPQTNL
ncbi:eukaryotic translation initiation factor 5B [Stegastes partitus]|uniref:Calmin n=1 Tax=Stegastes partitus TaxID=144197 RepID=A0A3B5A984_9TELE|nr:PREDICTED: eukaryotic translation initiation factor 5B-like [Stegastes partitus]